MKDGACGSINCQDHYKEQKKCEDDFDYSKGYPYPYPHASHNKDSQELINRMADDIKENTRHMNNQPIITSTPTDWEKEFDEKFFDDSVFFQKHTGYKMLNWDIKSFIHAAKEKSYQKGVNDMKKISKEYYGDLRTKTIEEMEHFVEAMNVVLNLMKKDMPKIIKTKKEIHPSGKRGFLITLPDGKKISILDFSDVMKNAPKFVKEYCYMGWESWDGEETFRADNAEGVEMLLKKKYIINY